MSQKNLHDVPPVFGRRVLPHTGELGATMMEFALVAPIMFFVVFLIVDFGRLFWGRVVLEQALEQAGKVARTVINLDVGRRDFDITEIEFRRSAVARQKVIDAAIGYLGTTKSIKTTYSGTGNGGLVDLLDITLDESTLPVATGEDPADLTSKVMVLLPGECATVVSKSERICNRQVMGMDNSDSPPTASPRELLVRYPLQIIFAAEMNWITPFFNKVPFTYFKVHMLTYRESMVAGPFGADDEPEELPGPSTSVDSTSSVVTTTSTTTSIVPPCVANFVWCDKQCVLNGDGKCRPNPLKMGAYPPKCECM